MAGVGGKWRQLYMNNKKRKKILGKFIAISLYDYSKTKWVLMLYLCMEPLMMMTFELKKT